MNSRTPLLLALLLVAGAFCPRAEVSEDPQVAWQQLDQGLQLGEYVPALKSDIGDSKITILRIDPKYYRFRLLESVQYKDERKTAAQWGRQEKLLACINAGMYEYDGRSVGYMRNYKYQNNPVFNKYDCILGFNPADTLRPAIKLIDRSCEADWEEQSRHYRSCTQSIRMIDCQQRNTWAAKPRKWSSAVWAIDHENRVLMLFCRSPYTMHDYINILLQSPLNIRQAMYLEGGPEASLYINSGGVRRELFGSYETGFMENDDVRAAFPLPNVIGIVKK